MAEYKVEAVSGVPQAFLSKGLHWDIEKQSLYFFAIFGNETSLMRYDFNEEKTYQAKISGEISVSFIIPIEGKPNQFAVGLKRRVGIIQWDGKSTSAKLDGIIFEVENEEKYANNQFNDGKADPMGRLYCGTMKLTEDIFAQADGSLYKYKFAEELEAIIGNICVSNGMAWNDKKRKMYYIDSALCNVREYDWDPNLGTVFKSYIPVLFIIANERVLISIWERKDVERPKMVPDGMTIDSDGNIYFAIYGGSKVTKVNTITGQIEMEIEIPARQVTSVAFGGPNLDILYVASAANAKFGEFGHLAGSLFKVAGLGVNGLPANKVRL